MTTKEFKAAFALAESQEVLPVGFADLGAFDGFALKEFQPVTVTLAHVAALIRYQAGYMSGGFDAEALAEVRECGRRRFVIAG
jgi:hypothetical protein